MAKHDELLRLINEFPELEIVPMVETEGCYDDHYWTLGSFGKCELSEYWQSDDRVYFKEDDFDDLVTELMDEKYDKEWLGKTDDEMEALAKEIVSSYKWVTCIAIYIGTT